jgi:hypothetical protein
MFSEEGFARLLAALERQEVRQTLVKVVPFSHELVWVDGAPTPLTCKSGVMVMGTYTLAEIAHKRGWFPGSFHNENFDYWVQAEHWDREMVNGSAWHGRLADVPDLWQPFFIRPRHDTKSFVGQVMDWNEFSAWRKGVLSLRPEDGATVTGDTLVMVAPKRLILKEYRVWMVDGKAVTASLYKTGTIKRYSDEVDPKVIAYAEGLAQIWQPARAYVVDVFDTSDGLKVGEVNNLNCSGFYAGNMQRLVAAVEMMRW